MNKVKLFNNAENNRGIIYDRLTDVANAVARSYSPFGSTTIIKSEHGISTTKDGKTILDGMRADDEVAQLILGYARSIANNTESVGGGDGTTTGALALTSLFGALFMDDDHNVAPGDCWKSVYGILSNKGYTNQMISNMGRDVVNKVSEYVESSKNTIDTLDDIKTLMDISTNGDKTLMDLISKSLDDLSDMGTVPKNTTFRYIGTERDYSSYKIVDGHSLDYVPVVEGYGMDNNWKNCVVLSSSDPVNDEGSVNRLIELINTTVEMLGSTINTDGAVIIIPSINLGGKHIISKIFSDYFKDTKTVPPVFIVEMEEKRNSRHLNEYEMLHAMMGTVSVGPEELVAMLHESISTQSVVGILPLANMLSTSGYMSFTDINVVNANIKDEKEKYLKSMLKAKEGTHEAVEIESVLASMNKACVTYEIGAKTPDASLRLKGAMDDACRGIKSAIENGYSYGCNSIILCGLTNIIDNKTMDEDSIILANGILRAYRSVTAQIYSNAGFKQCDAILDTIINEGKPIDVKGLVMDRIAGKDITDMEIISRHTTNRIINPKIADISILDAALATSLTLGLSNQILLSDRFEAGKFERGEH